MRRPGFTPVIEHCLVVATQANGDVLIHQKTFGKPFVFVDKLN
jgi:UDP-N-acetylglucosamine 1-carboxyvinyltransferase